MSDQDDSTALAEQTARLEASLMRLKLVHSIGRQALRLREIETLLDNVVHLIGESFGYYATSICLLEGDRLVCRAGTGGNPGWNPHGEWIPASAGVMGAALRLGRSRIVPDVSLDKDFVFHPALAETRSELAVPVFGIRGPVGVINIEADHIDAFDEQDRIAMEALADHLGVAIENSRLYEELRADNLRLQELDRIKTEFASMIGHDIRNPLTVIRGYAELLALAEGAPEEVGSSAERILAESEEVSRMADQMLALFRHEAVGPDYSFEDVAIAGLLDKVTPLRDETHPIEIEVDDDVPSLRADRRSLLQVLRNLTTNAMKYSPDGGAVTIRVTRATERRVRIEVIDRGVGVEAEDIPRLFAKFQRIWNMKTEGVRGTGLGLYICRRIIEDHGGSIGVSSEPGRGSTFSILLPEGRTRA